MTFPGLLLIGTVHFLFYFNIANLLVYNYSLWWCLTPLFVPSNCCGSSINHYTNLFFLHGIEFITLIIIVYSSCLINGSDPFLLLGTFYLIHSVWFLHKGYLGLLGFMFALLISPNFLCQSFVDQCRLHAESWISSRVCVIVLFSVSCFKVSR